MWFWGTTGYVVLGSHLVSVYREPLGDHWVCVGKVPLCHSVCGTALVFAWLGSRQWNGNAIITLWVLLVICNCGVCR